MLRILGVSLLTLIVTIALAYGLSLDWSSRHSASIASLPVYNPSAPGEGRFRIAANGFEFHLRISGPANAEQSVLLLHGFPENSARWQPLMEAAAAQGYRVAAFDQRGYSPGARPSGVASYHRDALVADVFAVADALGFERFHLVGHDWGAMVGWFSVLQRPDRIKTWAALTIPHPEAFFKGIADGGPQAERSRYFDTLKKPLLPEVISQAFGHYFLKQSLARLPKEQLQTTIAIHSEFGAYTAALNWYRAMNTNEVLEQLKNYPPVRVPTLFVGGTLDRVAAQETIDAQAALMHGPFAVHMLDAGHGLIQEQTDALLAEVLQHILGSSTVPPDL